MLARVWPVSSSIITYQNSLVVTVGVVMGKTRNEEYEPIFARARSLEFLENVLYYPLF